MSRRKQAKPRSLKRDEEWEDGFDQNVLKTSEQDYEMTLVKPDGEEEEEEEELRRAFSQHSEDYLRNGGPSSMQEPDLENQNSLDSEALGTGSSSWHSEDGGPTSRRGGETPSSCATPTSASFPSEPEGEAENGANMDGSNPTAPYPCQFCDRTFPRLSYLKKHEQSHGDQMPYRCSWCARLFKHKRSRDRHVKLHTGDRRYRCSHCEAAFSRSDHLKIHMKTHDTQKPYQCTACSRGYNTAAALTSHMQSHKKQQSSGLGSKLEMDFGRRSVSSHSTASPPVPNSPSPSLNLSMNPKNPVKCSPTVTSASNTPILNSPLKLTCMYCTRDSFTSMQQLQMHVHAMHQAILSGENMTMPSPGQISEISSVSRDKSFERQGRLGTNHEKKCPEDREKPSENVSLCAKKDLLESGYSCGQCTMKFSNFSSLRDHLVSIHRTDGFGTGLMMCPLCGIPCSSAAIYAEHYVLQHCDDRGIGLGENREYSDPKMNGRSLKVEGTYDTKDSTRVLDHGGIKSVKHFGSSEPADLTKKHNRPTDNYSAGTLLCGQCGAALKDFESFREHLARHLQADYHKEFPKNLCPKCDVSFQDREDMLDHLTKHFLGQMTKEYMCGSCKKYYPHPDLLQRHLLDSHTHHLYRCALCRDTFDSRVAIQVHFAVKHSQECRIYRCNVCSGSNNENSPGNAPGESRNVFKSEAEMANHVRSVHAPPVGDSPLPRSPASTPGTLNVNPRCVFCGVCCTSDLELQLHLASHSSSLYRCPICREGFAVEFLLDRHMQSRHASDHSSNVRFGNARENGRAYPSRSQENTIRGHKRGLSLGSGNNNSLNQRDNNNKRANYGGTAQHCELCERGEFANEAELQAHKKLAHTPSKLQAKSSNTLSLTCAYCGETCRSRNELESHTRIQHASGESGGRHKCNICDEVCPSGATLAEHKLQKHCKIQLSDTCVVCRGVLNTESLFMEHMQRHSLESVDPQQRIENSLPHLPTPCVVCRQTLISELECRLHARHHLRASGSQSSAVSPNSGQKVQNSGCCLCLREFSTEDFVSLPSNHTIGGGQPLRVCKPCYVRHTHGMPIMNSPYEHVRSTTAERCWTSSKDTNWDGSRDTWDNDRKYKTEDRVVSENSVVNDSDGKRCEDCGIKFEAAEDAEKHRLTEHDKLAGNASNTYTCIQCQMSFATEAKIRQHVKEDHLESSRKGAGEVLRCHLCMFEACSPLQLQCHLIEHTFAGCAALSCYICQALFTTPNGLQSHMLQQHGLGARPYDCSFCGLKFFFRAELDHHVVTFHSNMEMTTALRESASEPVEINREPDEDDRRTDSIVVKEEQMQDVEEEEVNVDEQDVEENESRDQGQTDAKVELTTNSELPSGKKES